MENKQTERRVVSKCCNYKIWDPDYELSDKFSYNPYYRKWICEKCGKVCKPIWADVPGGVIERGNLIGTAVDLSQFADENLHELIHMRIRMRLPCQVFECNEVSEEGEPLLMLESGKTVRGILLVIKKK